MPSIVSQLSVKDNVLVGGALVATGVALLVTAGIVAKQKLEIDRLTNAVENLTDACHNNLQCINILIERTRS